MRALPLLILLAACSDLPDEVTLEGTVTSDPDTGEALDGATLRSIDASGEVWAEAPSDAEGRFALPAPPGDRMFVEIESEGHVPTSHTGVVGLDAVQPIEDGLVFAISEGFLAEWEEDFAGCPDIGEGGATFGEVRISNLTEPDTGEHPLITTAVVTLEGPEGEVLEACYLDDEGTAWDPEAEATGATGRYAIFGAPPGEHTLVVAFETVEGMWSSDRYPLRIIEGGVSPRFPLWTDFEY